MSFGTNASCLMVLQGFVIFFHKRQTTINSPKAGIFNVKWKNNTLPEGVRRGAYITLVGKPITLDLGRGFLIGNAEVLRPGCLKEIKNFIAERKGPYGERE